MERGEILLGCKNGFEILGIKSSITSNDKVP